MNMCVLLNQIQQFIYYGGYYNFFTVTPVKATVTTLAPTSTTIRTPSIITKPPTTTPAPPEDHQL